MGSDEKPAVWVGHISLSVRDFEASEAFMRQIGMRSVVKRDDFAVLELRGGTHLVLRSQSDASPGTAGFDLMVDDLDAMHQQLSESGLAPTAIEPGKIHRSFTVQEPSGYTIKFNSSHVVGLV